jgi:hypothetical protein
MLYKCIKLLNKGVWSITLSRVNINKFSGTFDDSLSVDILLLRGILYPISRVHNH